MHNIHDFNPKVINFMSLWNIYHLVDRYIEPYIIISIYNRELHPINITTLYQTHVSAQMTPSPRYGRLPFTATKPRFKRY